MSKNCCTYCCRRLSYPNNRRVMRATHVGVDIMPCDYTCACEEIPLKNQISWVTKIFLVVHFVQFNRRDHLYCTCSATYFTFLKEHTRRVSPVRGTVASHKVGCTAIACIVTCAAVAAAPENSKLHDHDLPCVRTCTRRSPLACWKRSVHRNRC